MSWFRSNPFRTIEPKEFMVQEVAREAEREGQPLSEAEKEMLATEYTADVNVPREVETRLTGLVDNVMRQEAQNPPADYRVQTFCNAIEWAGDLEYPYVVFLAEKVHGWSRRDTSWKWKDVFRLVATAVVTVFLLFLVIVILTWAGVLK